MTVGGDRETHCGQRILVYHQGVRQGDGTCRQGLVLQIIDGRSRVGSTPRGETDSVRTFSCATRMGSLTLSLTPSLNPKMALTKFLRHVTRRVSVSFLFLSSVLFLYFIFTFLFIFYLKNQCTQIEHVLH
jgi:hypothetical protein